MSEEQHVNIVGSPRGLKRRTLPCEGQGGVKEEKEHELSGEETVAQDQILIIPPEIISMILKYLDFRNLKKTSLICRSWTRQARYYMRMRGIVQLGYRTIHQFVNNTQRKRLPELPQPFCSIDILDLHDFYEHSPEALVRIVSSLCPRLLVAEDDDGATPRITRLCPAGISLDLALPLIIQSCHSLEYLHLFAGNCEPEYVPPMDPEQVFPHLRHLKVDNHFSGDATSSPCRSNHFPCVVAWIVKASPELQVFESYGSVPRGTDRLASELLMKVDIQNVKSLFTFHTQLDPAALQRFLSIPFDRLENLRLNLDPSDMNDLLSTGSVLVATAAKCTSTLKVLDLTGLDAIPELMDAFPVCPVLQELSLNTFPYSTNNNSSLVDCFPSLQVLDASLILVDALGDCWRGMTPCPGLKTLRASMISFWSKFEHEEQPVKLLEKFPAVERVQLDASFLIRCCRLKASGDPRFSNLLEAVKHLEFRGMDFDAELARSSGFSDLAVLKGIETITMRTGFDSRVTSIPFSSMPSIKIFRFGWSYDQLSIMDQLLEISKRMKKVIVTNCCKMQLPEQAISKQYLEAFLDAAPNAECGCKEWEKRSPFYWNQ